MPMKREKRWYDNRGKMYLVKNSRYIREYSYQNTHDRKRMTKIWMSELLKKEGDQYELIYSPQI
jgi:hypothetical protein